MRNYKSLLDEHVAVTWLPTCSLTSRRACFLLLAFILLALFAQLTMWEAWSCRECRLLTEAAADSHQPQCSEVILNLHNPSWFTDLSHDEQLMTTCGVTPTPVPPDAALAKAIRHLEAAPTIMTKCGGVIPIPVSKSRTTTQRTPSSKRRGDVGVTDLQRPHNGASGQKQSQRPPREDKLVYDNDGGGQDDDFILRRQSNHSEPQFKVPNIVHYISFHSQEFKLLNYLSFYSVQKFIKPSFIYVHGDSLPHGYWWDRTLQDVRNIHFVPREIPVRIQNFKTPWIEHSSDIVRLQTILDNGGIYLDTDILVLKSFDPLRVHDTALGRETSYGLGSGVIVGRPQSPFVCMWFNGYRTYIPWPWHWAKYAVWTPNDLAKTIPQHIHIERDTFHHPTWRTPELMFSGHYDWSRSYSMHVWKRLGHVPNDLDDVRSLDNTLGEVMRYIYYGSKDLILDEHSLQYHALRSGSAQLTSFPLGCAVILTLGILTLLWE